MQAYLDHDKHERYVNLHYPLCIIRVGQNRKYTPYMTVCLVSSLPKLPYIHRTYMALANLMHHRFQFGGHSS